MKRVIVLVMVVLVVFCLFSANFCMAETIDKQIENIVLNSSGLSSKFSTIQSILGKSLIFKFKDPSQKIIYYFPPVEEIKLTTKNEGIILELGMNTLKTISYTFDRKRKEGKWILEKDGPSKFVVFVP